MLKSTCSLRLQAHSRCCSGWRTGSAKTLGRAARRISTAKLGPPTDCPDERNKIFVIFAHVGDSRLGIDPGSVSDKEFSAAYYRVAKRYHPDLNPGTAELMAHINAAGS